MGRVNKQKQSKKGEARGKDVTPRVRDQTSRNTTSRVVGVGGVCVCVCGYLFPSFDSIEDLSRYYCFELLISFYLYFGQFPAVMSPLRSGRRPVRPTKLPTHFFTLKPTRREKVYIQYNG